MEISIVDIDKVNKENTQVLYISCRLLKHGKMDGQKNLQESIALLNSKAHQLSVFVLSMLRL